MIEDNPTSELRKILHEAVDAAHPDAIDRLFKYRKEHDMHQVGYIFSALIDIVEEDEHATDYYRRPG